MKRCEKKNIIDVCCGSKMFWFDKNNENVVFMDNRCFEDILCDGRSLSVTPDIIGDFRNIPFENESFNLVVFDPPHLVKVGDNAWIAKKYGHLNKETYEADIQKGFEECFRVLKKNGVLVFKWNEEQIPTSEIIKLSPNLPLFGHKSGKRSKTQWLVFMKF